MEDFQYIKLSTFSWDQTDSTVKVYISLEGVDSLPAESLSTNFTSTSVVFTAHGLGEQGTKHYRFSVPQLGREIDPAKSKLIVKKGRVVISMRKAEQNTNFGNLHFEKPKEAKAPEIDKADPQAGIMDMMKNLYQDGDDEMKQMIAKTWVRAHSYPLTTRS